MNSDNLSALAVGIGVVALIAGFAVYFNSPELNKATGQEAGEGGFVPAVIIEEQQQQQQPQPVQAGSGNGTASAATTPPKVTIKQIDKSKFRIAPELARISGYINTDAIKLEDLRGKVVLVDFWTYSCINCIRTIPYLNAWHDKYAEQGLVIVGVHTPEFEFEKDYDNVKAAVEKFGIKYPVAQDNDKGTWSAYENRYWPRKYLVDTEGYIRYDHIGEGKYAETEKVIQSLLAERAALMGADIAIDGSTSAPVNAQSVDFGQIKTPELYFGYDFARAPLGNPEGFKPGQSVTYSIAQEGGQANISIKPNTIYLSGTWKNNADHMELQSEVGRVVLSYSAKSVNIVAGGTGELLISEDGSPLGEGSRGTDVSGSSVKVDGQKLYNLASHEGYGSHYLVIDAVGKGFQIYTFTFG